MSHVSSVQNPCVVRGATVVDTAAAAAAKSLQSCPTLCDPIDGSPPGSPVPGILQARTLEWLAISFSNAWKWKVKGKSLSRVRLLVTPWTAAYQAPPSMGFSRHKSLRILISNIAPCVPQAPSLSEILRWPLPVLSTHVLWCSWTNLPKTIWLTCPKYQPYLYHQHLPQTRHSMNVK